MPNHSSLDVSQAPWARWFTVKTDESSNDRNKQYLMMLYIGTASFEDIPLYVSDEEDGGLRRKKTRILFFRLPSNQFVLLFKEDDFDSQGCVGFHPLIVVPEKVLHICRGTYRKLYVWQQYGSSLTIFFDNRQDLWGLIRCISIARDYSSRAESNAGMATVQDEIEVLQARLKHMEETAFEAVLEASVSTD
ncbi:hypothetical protein EVJ58_g8725 [Rhodofomes roseus]|uniref:Uncharacterized protein n=1 Tax=Rhodofomes roseus TaxID=34475 RepID=A0A4Y9XX19_9APHY|nr:hypothetical protein EVJ58_g8725 [Rhodofomes roseus]